MLSRARHLSRCIPITHNNWDKLSLTELWELHEQGLTRYFAATQNTETDKLVPCTQNWLSLKLHLAQRLLAQCRFCVHQCQVDRTAGPAGYCQLSAESTLSGSYLHWGEEAPIRPTWALFFGGCTMHCVYCHNWRETFDLSQTRVFTPQAIASQLHQQRSEYKTISLIGGTPEPHLHWILELIQALDPTLDAPLVFNNNATLSSEGLALMTGIVDIYLPDFKHGNNHCAWQLTKISQYLTHMRHNLRHYLEQKTAILVRHLVLPGHLDCCTRPVLEILAQEFPGVAVNVMTQYRPMYKAETLPVINRRLSTEEEARVQAWVKELKIRQIAA